MLAKIHGFSYWSRAKFFNLHHRAVSHLFIFASPHYFVSSNFAPLYLRHSTTAQLLAPPHHTLKNKMFTTVLKITRTRNRISILKRKGTFPLCFLLLHIAQCTTYYFTKKKKRLTGFCLVVLLLTWSGPILNMTNEGLTERRVQIPLLLPSKPAALQSNHMWRVVYLPMRPHCSSAPYTCHLYSVN